MDVERHWYRSSHSLLTFFLLPLSWIFGALVCMRRALYRLGFKKTYHFSVPVIVVGNITVGGTGKTPFVIWLVNILKAHGFKPGIVSRGYGGSYTRSILVTAQSDSVIVGDEALVLVRQTASPLVISVDRVAAVKMLLANSDCDIIISDDGLQHYRLGRKIEIAIIDGMRRFGNGSLLPAGPLREPVSRLQHVDFIVTQQQAEANEYEMVLQGDQLYNVKDNTQSKSLSDFKQLKVHAVAAIGNPRRFFSVLQASGLELIEHIFPDHYSYQHTDFDFGDSLPIIMTEKDAVKCVRFADERFWYLPVIAKLNEMLAPALLKKIGEK